MSRYRQEASVVTAVKEACAEVAREAGQVRIEAELIPLYAASLPDPEPRRPRAPASAEERTALAAFWLTMDAINFGSGWFPTLNKRPGRSGYFTISDGLHRRFDREGPWTADELTRITSEELARTFGQEPGHELMDLFAESLQDLGRQLDADYAGSFLGPVEQAGGSAVALIETLAGWACFADTSTYGGRPVPFLKRAQIAAADLDRAGAAQFADLDQLTMFADNLVPHVLRLDGVLSFETELVGRIEREELIEHGSPAEVEMRACAVDAVEQIVAASPAATTAADIDQLLWHRGQQRRYKSTPRHRSRCTAY